MIKIIPWANKSFRIHYKNNIISDLIKIGKPNLTDDQIVSNNNKDVVYPSSVLQKKQ